MNRTPLAHPDRPARSRKRVAIIQSAYVPWRGFFGLIGCCDEYVILDSVQFAKRHWHNRNQIKTPQGPTWISIPVNTKARFEQSIDSVTVAAPWVDQHLRTIAGNYRRSRFFDAFWPGLEAMYNQARDLHLLTDINELFLRRVAAMLGIETVIVRDGHYTPQGQATDRLLDICLKAGATHYLSGPSARNYLQEERFRDHGIVVEWMNYDGYPEYAQLWGPFAPRLSIIDLIFNAGVAEKRLWARPG